MVHSRLDEDGMWTSFSGFEAWHGRANPEGSGNVATGCHDAARPTANDHGFGCKLRVVALFYGGVKGVAINMCD